MFLPSAVFGQDAEIPFGSLGHDTSAQVEISAERLSIDQESGSAMFEGNVVIGQGTMRLTAAKVEALYSAESSGVTGQISRLVASGGVTILGGEEAMEAQQADYSVAEGTIVLTGSVLMTQGQNAISAERAVVDLNTGKAVLEGRVRTILQTGGN